MRKGLLILLILGCGGCALPPRAPVATCASGTPAFATGWWQSFGDPVLLAYLQEAGRCNLELAQKRRLLARQRLSLAAGNWQPRGSLSTEVGQPLDGGELRRGHSLDLAVSYELDLWQRLAHGKTAERLTVKAVEQDWQALFLSLQAEVAMRYWDWVALRRQHELLTQEVSVRQALRQLDQQALQHGGMAQRQLHETEQAWLQAQDRLSQLSHQAAQAAGQLADLLDRPGLFEPAAHAWPTYWPALPPDQPSAVLARRPDVAAQSARVEALWVQYQQARLAFLPTLTLSATLGAASPSLNGLLAQSAGGGVLQLGLPFLDWNRLGIQREQLRLDWETATLAYEQTVRRALRELAMTQEHAARLRQDLARVETRLALLQQQEGQAELALAAGAAGQADRLRTRLQRLQLEAIQVDLLKSRASNLALLYKVLGGEPLPGPALADSGNG